MTAFARLLESNPNLWEKMGFYTFFLGVLLFMTILIALLLEKERWLLPLIVISFVLVGVMALSLERKGPLIPKGGKQLIKIVYLTLPAESPRVGSEADEAARDRIRQSRMRDQLPPPRQPQPRASISAEPGGRTEVTRVTTPPQAPPPGPVPGVRPASPPVVTPAPAPPSQPHPQPEAARTQPAAPVPSPPSQREPSTGGRTQEGLELPTGNLVIQITSTLLLTVPGEAAKAVMSISVDGRGVGGRKASSMKVQNDETGKLLNVTYFWKGVVIRLTNLTTGNHRISVSVSANGEGFNKSKMAWSGTVYVGEGATATVVLQGGFGDTLQRVQ